MTNLNLSLFYLDDGIIVGNINEVKFKLDTILQVSSDIGLEIDISKCEIWWPYFDDISWDIFPDSINNIYGEGIDLLGSSIGTSKFMNNHMDSKVNDCIQLQKVILNMENPNCELAIIRSCACRLPICKIKYSLRTSPTKFIANYIINMIIL